MNNFKPGGIRHRRDDIGGRPRSDANYSTKNRFDKKPRFESRGNDRGDRFENRGPKKEVELFKTTCTTCGKPCEVPFRPDGSKPVLCRDCFAQKNASPASTYGQNDRFTPSHRDDRKPERNYESPRASTPTVDISALTRQIGALEAKVNQILELMKTPAVKPSAVKKEVKVVIAPGTKLVTIKEAKPKKVAAKKEEKKPAKKVAVKKAAKKVAKK
jgi:CxxC-x17-CxxC domain-containing protein